MKKALLFILFPCLLYGQIQIGQDIDGEEIDDRSGRSVSLSSDGTIIAIGSPFNDGNGNASGQVRIYENQSNTWVQLGQDINSGEAISFSGRSVSLSSDGTIVAIGAPESNVNGNVSGQVRIYENQSGVWTQIGQDINGEAIGDFLGQSISLSSDGTIVAAGAFGNDDNGDNSGHVRIYENQSGVWTQIGQDIVGAAADDRSGISVSLSSEGAIVAVGAFGSDANGSNSGQVRIYENQSGVWTQIGQDINGEAIDDFFGESVSLSSDGMIVAIGAPDNDANGFASGHVRVYENQSDTWVQIGQDIDGEAEIDFSGTSVSLSPTGTIVVIGAPSVQGGVNGEGSVRIYENQGGTWVQIGQEINGEAADDESGGSVSISSNGIIAIGATLNDGNGPASGHVRVYDIGDLLSIKESTLSDFKLFPNPAFDTVQLELTQGVLLEKVNIYNSIGQFVQTTQETIVPVSQLSNGVYFFEIITNRGKIIRKLIKE